MKSYKSHFCQIIQRNYRDIFFSAQQLISLILIPLILLTSSCKKFTNVSPPDSQLTTTVVFENDATATAALTGIYGKMLRSAGFYGAYPSFSINGGLLADELINYSPDAFQVQVYNNNLSNVSSSLSQFYWAQQYNFIYQVNAILENLDISTGVSNAVKQQLTGEAKFIRAFCHFYLVNLFGDVPLVTMTDYRVNNTTIRTPKSEVYQQIILDLKDAKNLLNVDYVSATNAPTIERIRPNKSTATAMLARTYLYIGDWQNAETQANEVITNTTQYSLLPTTSMNNVFKKNSLEAIWQFQAVNVSNINTFDGNRFILTGAPTFVALSNTLINAFEAGDQRRANWVKSIPVGSNTYYYPYKYQKKTDATYSEYTMIFRLAEQYLIRAEARAQLDNISGARIDLDTIRARANLTPTTANDKASLLAAIEHERQVELFTEWGHRWLDLKRTGRSDAVLGSLKAANWQPTDVLFPIPLSEIQSNPNLTQNPGY